MCKTSEQLVHTGGQNYVGTFPQVLWKAVYSSLRITANVDNFLTYPAIPQFLYSGLSTCHLYLSHLFRPYLSAPSTHPITTTTIYITI